MVRARRRGAFFSGKALDDLTTAANVANLDVSKYIHAMMTICVNAALHKDPRDGLVDYKPEADKVEKDLINVYGKPYFEEGSELVKQLEHSEVTILCHGKKRCEGNPCTIHNRTDHQMRSFPQHWRDDRGFMERICPHKIGHPDPDDFAVRTVPGYSVHGCCNLGCCTTNG